MRLLILGGTIFYGRHVTEGALSRGHEVTLFTRGVHDTSPFEGARTLQGDRDGQLDALREGEWDAVLDTCGYVPRVVRQSAELLRGRVRTYAFISSISVFAETDSTPIPEDGEVQKLEDPSVEVVDGQTYGGLKALCEEVVRDVFGEQGLIVRPGLIVGPYDSSDRFTYWPWRMHEGGDVVVPDRPGQAVQFIDARDLASWTLDMLERQEGGTFNATGPQEPYVLGDVLDRVRRECGPAANLVPIPPSFLEREGAVFWTELPLSHGSESDALMRVDVRKAVASGLHFRALEETARDTLSFALSRGEGHPWRNGLPREKESRILGAWRSEAAS
jgi:2'-hydroxyisoflavone reductase